MTTSSSSARILDGKALSTSLLEQLEHDVSKAKDLGLVQPGLATVLVGGDPASHIYVRNKRRACERVGVQSFHHELPAETGQEALLALIDKLNRDPKIHGILVQLPLPKGFDYSEQDVLAAIEPSKDADGFHPFNQGALLQGRKAPVPCTPKGVMRLLDQTNLDLQGLHAVVVGRSNIVGKPVAMLLLDRHMTVTICHSRTKDLAAEVQRADVVVAAVGVAELIQGDWIKAGAVVLDVGINRNAEGKLVGDVDFHAAAENASWITPVPGGVGPMTIAMLLQNTVEAAHGDS